MTSRGFRVLVLTALQLFAALPAVGQSALPTLPDSATMRREYAARRVALMRRLGDGIVVALGAPEPAHDYQSFDQLPSFFYLTGWREPNAALVLVRRGDSVTATMFVEPRNPQREVWSGARQGVTGAQRVTGMQARTRPVLDALVDSLARTGLPLHIVGALSLRPAAARTHDDQFMDALRGRHPALRIEPPATAAVVLQQLRGRKSVAEQALIRRAAEITVRAHREAMAALEPGMNEFEIQALVEYTFRRNGADRPSFASIVGSGPNATTLHYNANDRFILAGDVLVLDIGASFRGYAADVTRTLPATGRFTADQRAVYQIVRDAQAAAERAATPGAPASRMSDSASAVIARGLARLGLIDAPAATYDCGFVTADGTAPQCPQAAMFYMHGLGHGIGLEVHDPDQFYFTHTLAAGSAFTIEPGIYVRRRLLEEIPDTPRNRALAGRIGAAVRRYADIGVRIEDDYLVTDRGTEWISRVPREIDEIERLMQGTGAGPAPRDAALVGGYRGAP